jgi:hypothetical protein
MVGIISFIHSKVILRVGKGWSVVIDVPQGYRYLNKVKEMLSEYDGQI